MEVVYEDLPDDGWRRAAEVMVAAWASPSESRVVVRPWRSPDDETVRYMLRYERTTTDGGFHNTGVVLGDQLLNKVPPADAAAAVTGFLASARFPARPISLGHLLDVLYLTRAIETSWTWGQAPSSGHGGWDNVEMPNLPWSPVSSLDYTAEGAVLRLYRAAQMPPPPPPRPSTATDPGWPPPSGPPPMFPSGGPPGLPPIGSGGVTMPQIERLEISFDSAAVFTQTILRRAPGNPDAWVPVAGAAR